MDLFSDILSTMPACYVCRKQNATIRMPSGDTLSLWARSLDLTVCPPVTSRICVEHFRDSDITVTVTGSRRVKSGALPTRELHGREEVNSDHTYSLLSKSRDECKSEVEKTQPIC